MTYILYRDNKNSSFPNFWGLQKAHSFWNIWDDDDDHPSIPTHGHFGLLLGLPHLGHFLYVGLRHLAFLWQISDQT